MTWLYKKISYGGPFGKITRVTEALGYSVVEEGTTLSYLKGHEWTPFQWMIQHLNSINSFVSLWNTKHWPGLTTSKGGSQLSPCPREHLSSVCKVRKQNGKKKEKKKKSYSSPKAQSCLVYQGSKSEVERGSRQVNRNRLGTYRGWHADHRTHMRVGGGTSCDIGTTGVHHEYPGHCDLQCHMVTYFCRSETTFNPSSSRHHGSKLDEALRRKRRKRCRRRPF